MNQGYRGIKEITLLLAIGLFNFSCSSGSGSGDGGGDGPVSSPNEALQRISIEHLNHFQKWKSQLVKSCNANEAFGLGHEARSAPTLDGKVLLQKTQRSLILKSEDKGVLISSHSGPSGDEANRVEETQEINGKTYRIAAEAKRSGSSCTLYLFGQKVYETSLLREVSLGSAWGESSAREAVIENFAIETIGNGSHSWVPAEGLVELISRNAPLEGSVQKFISDYLEISDDQVLQFFKFPGINDLRVSMRLINEPRAIWTRLSERQLIADTATMKKLFQQNAKNFGVEWRVSIPRVSWGGIENDQDQGSMKFVSDVAWEKMDEGFKWTHQSTEAEGMVGFSQKEAFDCLNDRAYVYIGAPNVRGQVQPSVSLLYSACEPFSKNLKLETQEAGLQRELMVRVLEGVKASSLLDYSGWDEVLTTLTLEALENKADLQAALDPQRRVPMIQSMIGDLLEMQSQIEAIPGLKSLREEFTRLSMRWAFSGLEVSAQRIGYILKSVQPAAGRFVSAVGKLLSDLSRDPEGYNDQLEFAAQLEPVHWAMMQSIQKFAQACDLSTWGYDYEREILSHRPTLEDLQNLNQTWNGAVAFTAREKKRTEGEFSTIHVNQRKNLILKAVKEGWSSSQFTELETIAEFAQGQSRCSFYKSLSAVADCAGGDLFSQQTGKFFDPQFGERYGRLAATLKKDFKSLPESDFFSIRSDLFQRFFDRNDLLWSSCTNSAFEENSKKLHALIEKIAKTDTFGRWDLERELRELLRSCR